MNSTAEAGTDEAKPAGAVGCGHFWFGKGARGLVVRGGDAGWNAFRRAARSDEPKKLVGCGRRRVATAAEWGPRPPDLKRQPSLSSGHPRKGAVGLTVVRSSHLSRGGGNGILR